ncbi:MAG: DNA primase [Solirubrobacteraceae bacterium]|nr:DNA primase [Solirubrobacteraceae bacterium]
MPRYRDDAKERIRDAVDFVALVEERTELRRSSGANHMGRCPFHEERTPSFSVNAQKKMFHCFGCGVEGDVFDYVQLVENVDFVGALELLAARTGIELEVEDEDPQAAERRRHRERLLELLERTAAFYERFLWESREAAGARAYLAERGLTEATLRAYRVGYAPSAWDTVLRSSQRAGFKARELHDAGLVVRGGRDGRGRVYDRFRARITFPLADARGRVLGFGARTMGGDRGPKYLNTAENEIFHKGRILYGAHLARAAAGKAGAVIVCEGYTDVLALHQAGVENVVASMGTALTEDQVGELRKLAPVVELALDADDAGQEAMLRAARVAASSRVELRVVPLPEGRDPADVALADGAEAVRALVGRSVPFVRFRVERTLARGDLSSAEGKDKVIEELRPAFATIGESVLREELLAVCADRLAISPDLARSLLLGRGRGARPAASAAPAAARADERPRVPREQRDARLEAAFLALCLALGADGARHLAEVTDEHFSDPLARAAARRLRDAPDAPPEDPELAAYLDRVRRAAERVEASTSATLEVERLQLDLRRVERLQQAAEPGARAALARERIAIRQRLDEAIDRSLR